MAIFSYAKRNAILREMGFSTYRAYLKSDLWRSIRERVLIRDGRKCRACCSKKPKRTATQVHHQSYDHAAMRGENLEAMIAVCGYCHRKAEFREGEKSNVQGANSWLKKRKAKRLRGQSLGRQRVKRAARFAKAAANWQAARLASPPTLG